MQKPKLTASMKTSSSEAYDAYVRQAVQSALDDLRPSIPHQEAEHYFALKRAALLQCSKPA